MIELAMIQDLINTASGCDNLPMYGITAPMHFIENWKWGMQPQMGEWLLRIQAGTENRAIRRCFDRLTLLMIPIEFNFHVPPMTLILYDDSIRSDQARAEGVFPVCYVLELLERSE